MRNITKFFAVAVAPAVIMAAATQAFAVVPAPVAWWEFNNGDGQSVGTFDGVLQDSGPNNIDLSSKEWNGAGGQPNSFITSTIDNGSPSPAGNAPHLESYVPSGATFAGAGTGYHMEGGTHRTYTNGLPYTQGDTIATQLNDFFSYRDVLEPEPNENAGGAFDAPSGSSITYNFWLAIHGAGSADDGTRFGSGASQLIGRASNVGGGHGGTVSAKLTGVNPNEFHLQLRNDPGIVSTSTITAQRDAWHHYVVQYDMTGAGSVTVWQDGGLLAGGSKEALIVSNAAVNGDFRLNNVAYPSASQRESGDFSIDDLGVWVGVLLSDQDVADLYNQGISAAVVPEPSTLVLAAFGLLGLGFAGWRRKRSRA